MIKVLWIVNKYVTFDIYENNYFIFLEKLQENLTKFNIELHYIFFNKNLKKKILNSNNHYYISSTENTLNKLEILEFGLQFEKKYLFTFKQSSFADILQNVSLHKNLRNIDIPSNLFNDFTEQILHFTYLEKIILSKNIDVIFSDVSPEAEMEFGRIIGQYHKKLVIKDYEGAFFGRSVFLKLNKFGSDEVIKCDLNPGFTNIEAENYIKDYIENKKAPYIYPKKTIDNKKIKLNLKNIINSISVKKIYYTLYKVFMNIFYSFEQNVLKKLYYDKYIINRNYFFFGFHLNQESTMVLRSQPFTNQTVLLEMLSRVLPLNHYIYVREHPHWRSTFSYKYLKKIKNFNNIKLISPDISIHDIISNSKGILTYNATTGIESLLYKKPVLSFASNIYMNQHPGVLYCNNLYLLGEYLVKLLKIEIDNNDTKKYIQNMQKYSYGFWLGSHVFISEFDANAKSEKFSIYLSDVVKNCLEKKQI